MRAAVGMLLAVVVVAPTYALVRAYSVEPTRQEFSGKVKGDENHPISQYVTCCWDELEYQAGHVELFAGEYGQGGAYGIPGT